MFCQIYKFKIAGIGAKSWYEVNLKNTYFRVFLRMDSLTLNCTVILNKQVVSKATDQLILIGLG